MHGYLSVKFVRNPFWHIRQSEGIEENHESRRPEQPVSWPTLLIETSLL